MRKDAHPTPNFAKRCVRSTGRRTDAFQLAHHQDRLHDLPIADPHPARTAPTGGLFLCLRSKSRFAAPPRNQVPHFRKPAAMQ